MTALVNLQAHRPTADVDELARPKSRTFRCLLLFIVAIVFEGVRGNLPRTLSIVLLGLTLIALKKVDVLSDKFSQRY